MSKLLSANFMRLRKSKAFWVCAISTLLLSAAMMYMGSGWARTAAERGYPRAMDTYFFQPAPYTGAIIAVFISLFLGAEYSDGTMRNKVIVGHTRVSIYLSNLLTCSTVGAILTVLWFLGGLPGLYLIGPFEMGFSGAITYFFVAIGTALAFTAIFVWVSMLSQNKAVTVVLALVLWVALIVIGSGVNDRLAEPEFNGGMAFIDGEFVMMGDTPNPLYLTGTVRTVFQLLQAVLPTSQAIAMANAEITMPAPCIAASLFLFIIITAVGVFLFHRKDLK